VLLFGIEFSRLYRERFTGSFFLSKTFEWAYVVPGFPKQAYRRIGGLMNKAERMQLLDNEFQEAGVKDAWWIGFSEASHLAFMEAHDLTISRFLEQPKLFELVRRCKEVDHHFDMVEQSIYLAETLKHKPAECRNTPTTPRLGIPLEWFWGAEVVLRKCEPKLVSNKYVELLARDAYRFQSLYSTSSIPK